VAASSAPPAAALQLPSASQLQGMTPKACEPGVTNKPDIDTVDKKVFAPAQ